MTTGRIFKWLAVGGGALFILAIATMFLVVGGPRPTPVAGTVRPPWLPPTATNIFFTSQEGFGWWRAAEFTIPESDFRAYASSQGWQLAESEGVTPPGQMQLGRPTIVRNRDGEEELVVIPKALVCEKRSANNGGVSIAYDPATRRAYFSQSHR
jgi:hypothetical protein